MTPELFLQTFDQLMDAPNAVAKMRELVLDLAVRGRLVQQDTREPPASLLVEAARQEREALIHTRKIRARPAAPLRKGEQPYSLPRGWVWSRLSDVGHELGQKVPDKPFSYIDVGTIDAAYGRISDRVETLEPGEAPSRARKIVDRGTVLYSTVRPYLLNVAIIEEMLDPEPIASTAFGILHPFAGISSRYLFYWLRSTPFTAYVQDAMKGMAYPAINDEKFYGGYIPLPPLAEQKRIVVKVDELMALCDRLEAQQREREERQAVLGRAALARFTEAPTPGNLRLLFHGSYEVAPAELRKTILTLAVRGKLVSQTPSDGTGEGILHRILTTEARQNIADGDKTKAQLAVPFELPYGWAVARLGSLLMPKRGISYGIIKHGPEPQHGGIHILRCSNVRFRRIDLTGIRKVNEELSEEYRRTILEGGEVLINVRGTLGGCAVVPPALKGYNVAREVAVIPVHPAMDPAFVLNVIASPYFQERVGDNLRGIAYEGLNLGLLREFLIPIPPLAEQRRIVAKVDELMALVDRLEAQLTQSRAAATRLLDAVVAELTAAGRSAETGAARELASV